MGDGANVNNKKIKARNLMPEIKYVGNNASVERQKIISFFNLHKKGKLTVTVSDITRAIEYEINSLKFNQENINNQLKFLVSLYCPDPFFKDVVETKEEIAIWQPSFEFSLEIPEEGIEMGYRESSLIVNVFNEGAVESGMTIKFKALATVENPSLFNVNTREYFKINRTMEAGEVITVTTHFQNKRVQLNKGGVISNAFNWIDLDSAFLQLDIGDNLLRYDASLGLSNLEVDIYHSPQYLGV